MIMIKILAQHSTVNIQLSTNFNRQDAEDAETQSHESVVSSQQQVVSSLYISPLTCLPDRSRREGRSPVTH